MTLNLFDRSALLFLPASNPRAIAKARASAADLVILDLEDAVRPEDKIAARAAAVEAVGSSWPMPVAIRVNGTAAPEHADDLAAVTASNCDLVIMPSIRSAADISALTKPVAAMIETAAAVLDASAITRVCQALIVGTNDLAADLRLPAGAGRGSISYALQHVVLSARAAGIAAFDGVFNRLDDPEGFAAEAAESRALGFDGKTLIHPDQIAPCHAAFAPSAEELDRARRLVAAASGGADRFEGAMVEAMHVAAARRLIARYG
ncbi:CoA ester lyase [Sphingomonas sp.]|uniref:HpcH/HpaI aldolase/citrate lyase family protein n=1 Tax=Sphingomonas sp. TaxID=28214 RepID=UPI00286CFE36|nr:CoA ester lyase [Sphingomonas sp.]